MSEDQAIYNSNFPSEVLATMRLVTVRHYGFDGRIHQGQIVVNQECEHDIAAIFADLLRLKFPIHQVVPIARYHWSDKESIGARNTSAFNYRHATGPGVSGNHLSRHAFGRAIDLNPYENPFVTAGGHSARPYHPGAKGTIVTGDEITQVFKSRGWIWGGDWKSGRDYQHFEKTRSA